MQIFDKLLQCVAQNRQYKCLPIAGQFRGMSAVITRQVITDE